MLSSQNIPLPGHQQADVPFKINRSQGTDISEPLPLSKQISLSSCSSSLSICDEL